MHANLMNNFDKCNISQRFFHKFLSVLFIVDQGFCGGGLRLLG